LNATPICLAPRCDQPAHNGHLCSTCQGYLRADIRQLPGLLEDLQITVARLDRVSAEQPGSRGSGEAPLPLRVGPMEARRDLTETLRVWAWHTAVRSGVRVTTQWLEPRFLVWWLTTRIADVDSDPLAGALSDEIGSAVVRGWRAVDKPSERRYAGPCDECQLDLYAHPRADEITCDCGARYRIEARRDWLLDQAEDHLLTATEMSRALPGLLPLDRDGRQPVLTAAMIRGWAHRGRLTQHPPHPSQPLSPTYRVGDVLDLFEELHHQDLAS
jgi:hypothetical protein